MYVMVSSVRLTVSHTPCVVASDISGGIVVESTGIKRLVYIYIYVCMCDLLFNVQQ